MTGSAGLVAGRRPEPARDKQRVRLPYEELEEMNPPTAAHVEAVYRLLAPAYRLPLLWLDWSGARVASVDSLRVGDYDERDRRVRLRASTTKTRQALWVELPDVLADALEASLGPRRTVTRTRGCSPASAPTGSGRRSRGRARRPACRCSPRTTCGTAGSRSCIVRDAPGRRSPGSSVSGS